MGPNSAMLGRPGEGLAIAQSFMHENRIRQAASSLGAAQYCIEEAIKYARSRKPFGQELARNQAISFPVVELATRASTLELLILKTASQMNSMDPKEIESKLGDKVSMCNYYANVRSHISYFFKRNVRSLPKVLRIVMARDKSTPGKTLKSTPFAFTNVLITTIINIVSVLSFLEVVPKYLVFPDNY